MSNLLDIPSVPEGWRVVPLGDVLVKIVGGGTPAKSNKAYWEGDIPWLTIKDMRSRRPADSIDHISEKAVEESSTNIIPADTVVIATRIGLGKVVRVPYDAAINQDLKALITPPEIDKGYLEYWIVSIADYLQSIGSGTTVKGIRLEQVRSLDFPIAPLEQQKRIVAEIEKQFSRLDEAVANLKRVKANLKRYKAAVLKAAVEGKLTEEWRKQHLPAPSSVPGKFYTYAILCDDDSIYIGHTDDIERRWSEHRNGQGAAWTQKHKPVKIAHYEEHDSRTEAAEREKWLKTGFGRKWLKRELAAGRTRQAGDVEPADKLLERILEERRVNWQGRGMYKEPVAPGTTGMPELPEGWVWVSLGQVIDEPKYGTSKKCDYSAGDVGVLRIPNVINGFIDSDDLKSADFDKREIQTYALKAGDLLTIRSNGSVSLVGQCALVRDSETEFLYAGYLIRMRPTSKEVSSEYLMACISSRLLRRQIEAKAKSTSGVNNINSGELQSLVIPLCIREEQTEIVKGVESMISIVSAAETQVDANLVRAGRLRQSILKKAFSGLL